MLRILKERRMLMGLTQAELAEAAGIETWLYSNLENGRKDIMRAAFVDVYRLLHYLDIPIEDIANGTNVMSEATDEIDTKNEAAEEIITKNETTDGTLVFLRIIKQDVDAKGVYTSANELIVLPGSKVSTESMLTKQKRVKDEERRRQLEADGVIKDRIFTREYCFKSPSLAATLISGMSISGTLWWRTEEGICLATLKNSRNERNI